MIYIIFFHSDYHSSIYSSIIQKELKVKQEHTMTHFLIRQRMMIEITNKPKNLLV